MLFSGQKLLIASHNEGKVAEIREMITPLGIKVISAAEAHINEPEETGDSFLANAELKARHCAQTSNLASLADDSGLVIPKLNGAPGIYSARWAGPGKDFSVAFNRIESEFATLGKSANGADAYFISVLCLCMPDGKIQHFEGRIDGILTFPPRGSSGFGYDPIFIPEHHAQTFSEMDAVAKNQISHRFRAFSKFIDFLNTKDD